MKESTLAEWKAEATRLYGPKAQKWRFRCPMCGATWSAQEFVDAGGEPGGSYQECIGRLRGAPPPGWKDGNPHGCDWAAYGLFGTAGYGRVVITPDGRRVEIFPFADELAGEKEVPAGATNTGGESEV